ncbi:MAG: glycine cleavage system aminomethyltransferase GcvT [Sphaerochaetaceae bacterium]|nr:glycine cleavage system aminomethyltransferase GcvT [Sphaerochaetaceae bacterium]
MKRTPLFDAYKEYPGVKLIDFGGWELPVNFETGIIAEHHAVRTAAGLFDVSHMGECLVTGDSAKAYLDWLCTNDIASMVPGQVMYTFMCYPSGTVVDDLIVYCISETTYLVVLNASNTTKDLDWMIQGNPKASDGCSLPVIRDLSAETVQIALQGPRAEKILTKLLPSAPQIAFFRFDPHCVVAGVPCLVSRTGYTGEDGFELYCSTKAGIALWNALLEAGKDDGLIPCGLGARDTLRMEAKLPLYGHEISDRITPLEANLAVFVKLDKGGFCGRESLAVQQEQGIPRSLRGIEMVDGGVPRQGYPVFLGEREIGFVTSGAKSPTLEKFCGYVLIDRTTGLKFGDIVEIEIHGKKKRAKLVKTPFYKRGVRNDRLPA